MMALAEAHLVERARAGDVEAFEATHAALDRRRGKRAGWDVHFEDLGIPSRKGRGRGLDWDMLGEASSPTPESEFLSRETRWLLRAAIDRLSAPRQLVLRLMTLEGLSCEATARMVGESVAAVKSRLHRARKTLRMQLPALRASAASRGGAA